MRTHIKNIVIIRTKLYMQAQVYMENIMMMSEMVNCINYRQILKILFFFRKMHNLILSITE